MRCECGRINVQSNVAECSYEFYVASNACEFCDGVFSVYRRRRPPFATANIAAADNADASDSIGTRCVLPRRAA